ncbi:MAG: hypothetical protein PHT84_01255 [Candidatus Pacebacteria bacterium]|nr:hypothetical protein [Candidatus Paceibacterota bacterium]
MINPQSATIAIKSCQRSDYRSERIKWENINDMHCCEFYSKYLISSIFKSFIAQNEHQKYYIKGHYIRQENLVVFHINDMNAFQEGELI